MLNNECCARLDSIKPKTWNMCKQSCDVIHWGAVMVTVVMHRLQCNRDTQMNSALLNEK